MQALGPRHRRRRPLVQGATLLALVLGVSGCSREPVLGDGEPANLVHCVVCHGVDGRSRYPGAPNLGGRDAAELAAALIDYRSGARNHAVMRAAVARFSADELAELADWYAAQPPAR